jgi:hypothetical protein
MKYDDLTLMKFADGELDKGLTAEIESARINDKELQSYIEVFETTRDALIGTLQEETIPDNINKLIDNFKPVKKQNWFTQIVKKNPFKTSIFSAILASLIAIQGTTAILLGAGGVLTATTRGIEIAPSINDDVSKNEYQAASMKKSIPNELIESELNRVLSVNPNSSYIDIEFDEDLASSYMAKPSTESQMISLSKQPLFVKVRFLGSFQGNDGNNCKAMQLDDQYLIACNSKLLGWKIQNL